MRGMLMGEARLKTSVHPHPAILLVKCRTLEAFAHQYVYTPRVVGRLRVYWRKRVAAAPTPPIVKLLIQSALTLANRTKGPVYRQHPIWG
jgi:hypothetical protein